MSESTISLQDAHELKQLINNFVNRCEERGFSRVHIGAAMAGVGLAIHHVNGGDFERVIQGCRAAVEKDQLSVN